MYILKLLHANGKVAYDAQFFDIEEKKLIDGLATLGNENAAKEQHFRFVRRFRYKFQIKKRIKEVKKIIQEHKNPLPIFIIEKIHD